MATVKAGATPVAVKADVEQFRRLLGKSSDIDKKLKTALRRNIRQAAGVAAEAAKSEVANTQGGTVSATPQHKGLRAAIASGITVKVMTGARAGVTIVASSSKMPAGQESLVRAWEIGQGSAKGWRHPVFGTDAWTTQKGHPYFAKPIFDRKDTIRKAVEDAMAEALKSLEG